MIMSMMVYINPTIELDDRLLEVIWKYCTRIRNFYDKYDPPEEINRIVAADEVVLQLPEVSFF